MAKTQSISALSENEVLRRRLEAGSLNLRGVVATLRLLEDEISDEQVHLASVVRLLARVVDEEADAMGDAEGFLNGKAVA
jgi:hypothetical protein